MVTKSEAEVIEEYKKKGYFYLHSGCPDFLFYKIKEGIKDADIKDIDISSIVFCEVKYNGDVLSHEQQIWKYILEQLKLDYKLIHIPQKSLGIN